VKDMAFLSMKIPKAKKSSGMDMATGGTKNSKIYFCLHPLKKQILPVSD